MKAEIIVKLLQAHQKHGKPFRITVEGISMNPVLSQGDVITLKEEEDYRLGDILVFNYKQEGVLVHRLVKKKGNRYWCKGDNAFRTEEIQKGDIIGRASARVAEETEILLKRGGLTTKFIIFASLMVNRSFLKAGCVAETKKRRWYKIYQRFYLRS